jgi:hypothetical protein
MGMKAYLTVQLNGCVSFQEELGSQLSETSLTSNEDCNAAATPVGSLTEEEGCQNPDWKERKKHVFILSAAGKPIYSRWCSVFLATVFTNCTHSFI